MCLTFMFQFADWNSPSNELVFEEAFERDRLVSFFTCLSFNMSVVKPKSGSFQTYLQRVAQEDGASPEGVTETVVPASEMPHGLSPSMAESARAVFAAFMWHEGKPYHCIHHFLFSLFKGNEKN